MHLYKYKINNLQIYYCVRPFFIDTKLLLPPDPLKSISSPLPHRYPLRKVIIRLYSLITGVVVQWTLFNFIVDVSYAHDFDSTLVDCAVKCEFHRCMTLAYTHSKSWRITMMHKRTCIATLGSFDSIMSSLWICLTVLPLVLGTVSVNVHSFVFNMFDQLICLHLKYYEVYNILVVLVV